MKKPASERPKLDIVWAEFLDWISTLNLNTEEQIIFCAYGGFSFDFRVLLWQLNRYNLKIAPDILLIDPGYDLSYPKMYSKSLAAEFKNTEKHVTLGYKH